MTALPNQPTSLPHSNHQSSDVSGSSFNCHCAQNAPQYLQQQSGNMQLCALPYWHLWCRQAYSAASGRAKQMDWDIIRDTHYLYQQKHKVSSYGTFKANKFTVI